LKKIVLFIFIFFVLSVVGFTATIDVVASFNVSNLNNPYKLAVNKEGFVYVVDTINNAIKKFSNTGDLIKTLTTFNNGDTFKQPQGVLFDFDSNLYVIDTGNNRIIKFSDKDNDFIFLSVGENLPDNLSLKSPRAGRIDKDGNLFIADTANNRVIKGSTGMVIGQGSGGISAKSIGNISSNQITSPYGIDLDNQGNLYVADTENHKIKKYGLNGELLMEIGEKGVGRGEFLYPCDVALDCNENIYVADTENHRIQKFDKFGKFICSFGTQGLKEGNFFAPRGISIDKNSGFIYVADAEGRIQKFNIAIGIADAKLSNKVFSTKSSANKRLTELEFYLKEEGIVSIDVFDSNGGLVKSLVQGLKQKPGSCSFSWNGDDNASKLADSGEYSFRIEVHSEDNVKNSPLIEKTVIIDNTPLGINLYPPLIELEYGRGDIKKFELPYKASKTAEIKFEIKSISGKNIYISQEVPPGSKEVNLFVWNALEANVKIEKEYVVYATASDEVGNICFENIKVTTDDEAPKITGNNPSKKVFSPRLNQIMTVSFEVKDNIFDPLFNLKAYIEDENSRIICEILSAETVPSGEVIVSWNGRDLSGNIVEDGTYKIVLKVNDGVGNLGYSYLIVEADSTPPTATAIPSAAVFSPNDDGKFDSINFKLKSNEKGTICFKLEKVK